MKKITLKGYLIVLDSDLEAVVNELPNHIKNTKSEAGCIIFEVNQSQLNKHKFDVYEEFIDKEAFEFHKKRVNNSKWGAVTKNCERHYTVIGMQ